MLKFSEYLLESKIGLEDLILPDLKEEEKLGKYWQLINQNIEQKFQIIKDEVNQHVHPCS